MEQILEELKNKLLKLRKSEGLDQYQIIEKLEKYGFVFDKTKPNNKALKAYEQKNIRTRQTPKKKMKIALNSSVNLY